MNLRLLQNSLLLASCVTLCSVALGCAAALFGVCLSGKQRWLLKAAALASIAWPPFFVANAWLELLSPNTLLRNWTGISPLTLTGAVIVLSSMLWPITFLMALAALNRVPRELLEVDIAVRGWNLVRAVLLPIAAGSVRAAALLTFVLALNNFAVPAVLQVKVLPAEVWIAFSTLFKPGAALLAGWPLIVMPAVALFLMRDAEPWRSRNERYATAPVELVRAQLGRTLSTIAAVLAFIACAAGAIIPAAALLLDRNAWTQLPGALAAGRAAVWNSAWQPAVTASVLCAGALLLQWPLLRPTAQRRSGLASWLAQVLVWVPFFAPGVMLGIGLIWLLNRPQTQWLYQSALIVVLALCVRYLPVALTPIRQIIRGGDSALIDAAFLHGASRMQILRHVLWPTIAPRLAAVWYVLFLLLLWDVETLLLLYPPGSETLAFNVFNFLHYGYAGEVNALCMVLVMLALCPLVLWQCAKWLRAKFSPSVVLFACAMILATTGCSPSADSASAPMQSLLFEQAQVFGTRGAGLGQFNKPRSVAVDSKDYVYAVDMTGRVQKFDSNGVFVLSWQVPQTDLGKPKGMTRGKNGEIVIIEPHYQRLTHYGPGGEILAQWGRRGTNDGEFLLPRGVAVNRQGTVYVSEYTLRERVQIFTEFGRAFAGSFGKPGTGPGEFNRPEGICVDAQGRVYVADSCNHRIQIFSSDGAFLREYGTPGVGRGQLSYPYDIAVDEEGAQYVCEFGNSRIQVFSPNCEPLEVIGVAGPRPGQFSNPWGIALDSRGNLWVADSQNHRLQKLVRRKPAATGRT